MKKPHWINHNNDHIRDNEKWLKKTIGLGLKDVGHEIEEAIEILKKANRHIELAYKKLQQSEFPKIGVIFETEKPTGKFRRLQFEADWSYQNSIY